MSRDEKSPIALSVIALRAENYAADGNIVISLRTKYSAAERKFSVPVECFKDLIIDLKRLNASLPSEPTNGNEDQAEPLLLLEMPVAAE